MGLNYALTCCGVGTSDVIALCDEFPELEMRLQSFRKAGLKLSLKGQKSKQARALKALLGDTGPPLGGGAEDHSEAAALLHQQRRSAAQQLLAASPGGLAEAMAELLAASSSSAKTT